MHPFVLGELACGNLHNRDELLTLLKDLPQVMPATHDEVLFFIERHALMGRGIGYVDAHLLAAVALPVQRDCGRGTSTCERQRMPWRWRMGRVDRPA